MKTSIFATIAFAAWILTALISIKVAEEKTAKINTLIEKCRVKDSIIDALAEIDQRQDSIIESIPPYLPNGWGYDENGEYILPTKKLK